MHAPRVMCGRGPRYLQEAPFLHHLDHAVATFLFWKKKILLSLLRGTPGAAPWQEGKRFSSQMKGPCAWQRRASQEGVCGVAAGALDTLLLASAKVLQQRPPNDHPWNLRAGWSASNEKNNAWQVCRVTPEGNSDF